MRKKVFMAALACGLLAVFAAAPTYAQLPGTALRATIPFDFSVRGKILPAGDYEIKRISETPDGLIIADINDRHEQAIFETLPVEAQTTSSKAELVFHRYGDTYFLSEVLAGGWETGRELLPSRQERMLRREMARNGTEPEAVSLAAAY